MGSDICILDRYSAINGYVRYNKAALLKMPAEVLNIIARENIQHNLSYKYYEDRIGRLMQSNAELEEDSKEELEKAAKENGITDFKSIVRNVWLTQNLGVLNAEIEDVKSKNQQTTAAGQAVLRSLELRKKILETSELETNALYMFCCMSKKQIKIIEITNSSTWLYQNKLLHGKFIWSIKCDKAELTKEELKLIIEGAGLIISIEHKGENIALF